MLFYFSYTFLFYRISVWGSTNKSFFSKLRSLQNQAFKAIGYLGWHASPKHLYNRFKILKLGDVYKTELSKFVHRIISKNNTKYFDNYYTEFKKINKRNTRSSSHQNTINKTGGGAPGLKPSYSFFSPPYKFLSPMSLYRLFH